jgi:diaminopimelate epimerase
MNFVKMEGLGNDFVVVGGEISLTPEQVRSICDRRWGIGADGLLQVSVDRPLVVMGYWNADGSQAEMCGNGLRCVARYAVDHGLVKGPEFVVTTPAGPRRVQVGAEPRVELGPVEIDERIAHRGLEFQRARVGNPHAVVQVEEVGSAPVDSVGTSLQALLPGGTNVEFVKVVDRSHLRMRVWERGVGETLACGSGMAAAAAVTHHLGLTGAAVEVAVPGGVGRVELIDGVAWISGSARYVFRGEVEL